MDKVRHLESVVMQLEQQAVAPSSNSMSNFNSASQNMRPGKRTSGSLKQGSSQEIQPQSKSFDTQKPKKSNTIKSTASMNQK